MYKILLLAVFMSVLHSGLTLRCYACDYKTNAFCMSAPNGTVPYYECGSSIAPGLIRTGLDDDRPFDTDILRNFDVRSTNGRSDGYQCMTLMGTNKLEGVQNFTLMARGCALLNFTCERAKNEMTVQGYQTVDCKSCTRDLCNGSSTVTPATLAITTVILLLTKTISRNL